MLKNVVDVDMCMHTFFDHFHGNSAAILFDFEAAFPSISHEYMW